MQKQKRKIDEFLISFKLGFFLAIRQMRRSNKATTALIIFIMTLTFLNLVVVRGVLIGIIEGSTEIYQKYSTGEVFVSELRQKSYIENSPSMLETIKTLPWVESFSPRYLERGNIEADYKSRIRLTDAPNSVGAIIAGINPVAENNTTDLSSKIIEGKFLSLGDTNYILLGSSLLKKYMPMDSASFTSLRNVKLGDKVRIKVDGNTKELTVKGVIRSKADEVDFRAYVLDSVLRNMIGRTDYNVNEVAIKLKAGANPIVVKDALLNSGIGDRARVQTANEALPKFIIDVKKTFAILGDIIGSIGLVVAAITIFIVIFVNAITRKKFIGIMKGIGISAQAIEISYVFQSLFYAIFGIGVGLLILYGFLVPFINTHPIKFPFSDGILVAKAGATFFRVFLLALATIIAGFIPARIVVKKNTLDSILGR